jgi:hypothetical protein
MNHPSALLVATLTCAAMLAGGDARAQARGPSTKEVRDRLQPSGESTEVRVRKLAELESWLRRLAGTFRVRASGGSAPTEVCSSSATPSGPCQTYRTIDAPIQATFEGLAECNDIGDGPGVFCRFHMTAVTPPMWIGAPSMQLQDPNDIPFLPVEILFGIDPENLEMRMMWVGGGGAVWLAEGPLSGISINTGCDGRMCRIQKWVHSTRDGNRIEIGFLVGTINTSVELRRTHSTEENER